MKKNKKRNQKKKKETVEDLLTDLKLILDKNSKQSISTTDFCNSNKER